jgi:hypothetical protein
MFSRNDGTAGHLASDYPLLLLHVLVRLDRITDPAQRYAVADAAARRAAAGGGARGRAAEMQRLGKGLERLLGLESDEDN